MTTAADGTVFGDGAEWIWNLAADVWPQAAGMLYACHAIEHLAEAVRAVRGESTADTAARTAAGRQALSGGGKVGIGAWIADALRDVPAGASEDPLLGLAGYRIEHPTRPKYADRLGAGRTIGSGQVEGAVEHLVNRRLKKTGAKWTVAHVGPLVKLAARIDTPDWAAA